MRLAMTRSWMTVSTLLMMMVIRGEGGTDARTLCRQHDPWVQPEGRLFRKPASTFRDHDLAVGGNEEVVHRHRRGDQVLVGQILHHPLHRRPVRLAAVGPPLALP